VLFCGCGNWSVRFSEELMMRVFENRVLRGIFGFKGTRERGVERTT